MTAAAASIGAQAKVERESTPAAWFALAVFSFVTLFAYVDRTIFALLAEPIRRSMGLNDVQLGLLQGTGLALFAGLAYYPIGWLADRFDRRLVMVLGISVWSAAVVACGLARSFWPLFAASAMVGAGEASLAPVFYSMIPELFRGGRRQLANSIFGVTAASVGGLAIVVSGQLPALAQALRPGLPAALAHLDVWRLSFFAAAAPAPLMIALILCVRLGGPRVRQAVAARPPVLPFIRSEFASLAPLLAGSAAAQFGFAAGGTWIAVILMRYFGQTPASVGSIVGLLTLVSTAVGFALSLIVTRIWGPRLGPRLPIRALWISYLIAIVADLALAAAPSAGVIYGVAAVSASLTTAASLLTPTALQSLAPRVIRGRFIALFFTLLLLASASAGPLVGAVSETLAGLPRSLLLAAALTGSATLALGAVLVASSERRYARTVEVVALADAAEA